MADLLPPNATPLEQAWSEAIGQRLDRIEVPLRSLWDPQTCPLPLLPWLAWALSVDAWDPAWDEQTKRRVVSEAIAVHRVKGTTGSLRRALDALGAIYDLEELSGADHHRIRLTLRNSAELALHGVSQIVPTVERVKRASVHYTLRIAASTAGAIQAAAGIAGFVFPEPLRLRIEAPLALSLRPGIAVGQAALLAPAPLWVRWSA